MKVKDILEFLKDKDPEMDCRIDYFSFWNGKTNVGKYFNFRISEAFPYNPSGEIVKDEPPVILIDRKIDGSLE